MLLKFHGATAAFQHIIDRALAQYLKFAFAYIGDIIICSLDWPTHMQHMARVLQALVDTRLTANPRKSYISLQELKYLGFLVG